MSELVTAELLAHVARYSALPLSADRAELLVRALAPALARFRALDAANYDNLTPAVVFRVPPPEPPATS